MLDKKRLAYIDFLRAIAVISVVFGSMLPAGCWPSALVNAFNVPLFCIVGGILCTPPASAREYPRVLKSVTTRLIIPYLIFFTASCSVYLIPSAKLPDFVAESVPTGFFDLLGRLVLFDGKTVWNSALWFMPCYILVSLIFPAIMLLFKKEKCAALSVMLSSFLAVITLDAFSVSIRRFGIENSIIMLGFFAAGYLLRPLLDKSEQASSTKARALISLGGVAMLAVAVLLTLRANAVPVTDTMPAGYYDLNMYAGQYNGVWRFVLLALFLSLALTAALIFVPQSRAMRLISGGSMFVGMTHMLVFFDKTFTAVNPYVSMWEIDMRIAYRDAASITVIFLFILLVVDFVKRKAARSASVFKFIGIK